LLQSAQSVYIPRFHLGEQSPAGVKMTQLCHCLARYFREPLV
jgi:hypothetical protein